MEHDPLSPITSTLVREQIIPDILPASFQPSVLFSILYPSCEVLLGNELTPEETVDEPSIIITPLNIPVAQADSSEGDPSHETSYTLIMLDPDAPTRAESIYRSFRHWVV